MRREPANREEMGADGGSAVQNGSAICASFCVLDTKLDLNLPHIGTERWAIT